ncbi:MAG TPA: hypothetical protein VIH57_23815 [Bacteroidales bacterium]
MEAMKEPRYEKWVIIPVIAESNAVAKIDFKMPVNMKHCTGVAFSITDVRGAFNPSEYMGEISLQFNNRKSHPLNFQTEYKTSRYRMDHILIKLEEPLNGGSRVSGYYRNYIDVAQSLNIYLQCIAEPF